MSVQEYMKNLTEVPLSKEAFFENIRRKFPELTTEDIKWNLSPLLTINEIKFNEERLLERVKK